MTLDGRALLLNNPRFAPIETWREGLVAAGHHIPHVDPLDGGADARLLILLETPGPGTEPLRFVSRDNPTGTARNLGRFLDKAGIARRDVVLWNAVPWVVHAPGARNRALRRSEIESGLAALPGFLALLPRLQAVVLAGRVAALARPVIERERPGLPIALMPHPSPTYVCTSPAIGDRIRIALAEAAAMLSRAGSPIPC